MEECDMSLSALSDGGDQATGPFTTEMEWPNVTTVRVFYSSTVHYAATVTELHIIHSSIRCKVRLQVLITARELGTFFYYSPTSQ